MTATAKAGFRSMLCAVDFSEQSRIALRFAETTARLTGAALTVVYVNDPLLVAAAAAALRDRAIVRRSLNELDTFIEATFGSRSTLKVRVKSSVAVGFPADEILKAAARHRADLIVVGTQGLTGAGRVMMGSTTLGILQRTVVPVLAVPRRSTSDNAVPHGWPGDQIVAPVEFSSTARRDVEVAAGIAALFDASLLLVHVIERISAPLWFTGDLAAHDRIRVADAERQLDELAEVARRRVATEIRVASGEPGNEIAALAAEERTQLLITALRDRRGWFGSSRGSVSYHVLSHAVAPVLAHPPHWRLR